MSLTQGPPVPWSPRQPGVYEPVRISGLCGSVNPGSHTRQALELVLGGARSAGAQVKLVDLADFALPFAGSLWTPDDYPHTTLLSALMQGCDGMVWATPEYHGSYSGVLKNALDLGYAEYEGKTVALMGVAGGSIGAINALGHLRGVARHLHAWVLPGQVSVARADAAFDADGRALDPALARQLAKLGRDLVHFARLHAGAQPPPDDPSE